MDKIKQLDKILSNKIAAGEVVERPMSVVKELVENSIDAHSSKIDIFIEDGGLQSIKVVDNGEGMSLLDARLCFSTHATSKIKDENDLFNISTLGFRGEAIPSIASVSVFDLKTSQEEGGTHIVYEYGKRVKEESLELPKGTNITVSQLFQNVPARLKYMKSVNAEFSAIQQFIERIALAHPSVAFSLTHNQKMIFKTNGKGQLLEVIAQIHGVAVAKNMIPISMENDEFSIHGYISKIDTSRSNKNNIITLVNHRFVKNMMSIDAINSAYRQYLADNRFPIAVVNIDVDPYLVDVNVHPAKLEVRFSKDYALRELIYDAVSTTLKNENLTYQIKNKPTERKSFKPSLDQVTFDLQEETPIVKEESKEYKKDDVLFKEEPMIVNDQIGTLKQEVIKEEVKPIQDKINAKAQIHGTYIVGENEKGLYLIDQHAAQERINYEYYKNKYAQLDLTMQPLLVPLQFEYPKSDFLMIEERKELLQELGISLEVFSEQGYIVRELPLWMKNIDEHIFIDTMIQELLQKNKVDVVELQEHAIATLSCKASLKANTFLSVSDMQGILDNLMRCENPYVCPHGRPTVLFYSDYDLEKLFKRVV